VILTIDISDLLEMDLLFEDDGYDSLDKIDKYGAYDDVGVDDFGGYQQHRSAGHDADDVIVPKGA